MLKLLWRVLENKMNFYFKNLIICPNTHVHADLMIEKARSQRNQLKMFIYNTQNKAKTNYQDKWCSDCNSIGMQDMAY